MIGEALEITIIVSMIVLVVYPSSLMILEALATLCLGGGNAVALSVEKV